MNQYGEQQHRGTSPIRIDDLDGSSLTASKSSMIQSSMQHPANNLGRKSLLQSQLLTNESPLRKSSGERLSRGGFLTTDPRNNAAASGGVFNASGYGPAAHGGHPDTDLYYSTDKSSGGNLMDQAMSIHRRKKKMQTN